MDDDELEFRQRVEVENNEIHSRLRELYGAVEHNLDQQAILSNGLQTVATQQQRADMKLDSLATAVGGLTGSMLLVKVLVVMPSLVATFVLLRVLWILRGSIFEDAQALLALVSP